MRYNRKACQRAIKIAFERNDARVLPFGLMFSCGTDRKEDKPYLGMRQCYLSEMRRIWPSWRGFTHDDDASVRFVSIYDTGVTSAYEHAWSVTPAVKPRSLKKHELRKQARDLRRMKQYD